MEIKLKLAHLSSTYKFRDLIILSEVHLYSMNTHRQNKYKIFFNLPCI